MERIRLDRTWAAQGWEEEGQVYSIESTHISSDFVNEKLIYIITSLSYIRHGSKISKISLHSGR